METNGRVVVWRRIRIKLDVSINKGDGHETKTAREKWTCVIIIIVSAVKFVPDNLGAEKWIGPRRFSYNVPLISRY